LSARIVIRNQNHSTRAKKMNIVHMMLRNGYVYASTAVSFRGGRGLLAAAVRLSVAGGRNRENDACSTAAVG
jgi:hypothetical protein